MKNPRFAFWAFTAVFLGYASLLQAATLMLDFGTATGTSNATAGAATGSSALVSPAHHTGALGSGDATWNLVGASDIASGLVYSNGAAATGVSINLGQEATIGDGTISFTAANNINATGLAGGGSGIYAGNAPTRNGIFVLGTTAASAAAIGMRIDGLAAGSYVIYLNGRNTNIGTTNPVTFHAATGASANSYTLGLSLNTTTIANSNVLTATSFADGISYGTINVTIGAGESLFLAAIGDGAGSGDDRGFINSIQIVPEPSAALLGICGLGVLSIRRRRN